MCLKRNASMQVRIGVKYELQIWFLSILTVESKRQNSIKVVSKSFFESHSNVSYMGLYIKGTL